MPDIYLDLMDAIETQLAASTVTGQPLASVRAYFVNRTGVEVPPEFGAQTPLIVVNGGLVTSEPLTLSGCMMRKEYPISFSVYTENAGDTRKTLAATILDVIEGVFFNQNFSLSDWVDVTSKDYTQSSQAPFSGNWSGSAEIIFTHVHADTRAI